MHPPSRFSIQRSPSFCAAFLSRGPPSPICLQSLAPSKEEVPPGIIAEACDSFGGYAWVGTHYRKPGGDSILYAYNIPVAAQQCGELFGKVGHMLIQKLRPPLADKAKEAKREREMSIIARGIRTAPACLPHGTGGEPKMYDYVPRDDPSASISQSYHRLSITTFPPP